jgi:archaellum component FlaC
VSTRKTKQEMDAIEMYMNDYDNDCGGFDFQIINVMDILYERKFPQDE